MGAGDECAGETWTALEPSPALGMQAVCQGSMIAVGSTLFYSHGFGPSPAWSDVPGGKYGRADGWIMASTTAGKTWFPWRQVDPNEFGCKSSAAAPFCVLHRSLTEALAAQTPG